MKATGQIISAVADQPAYAANDVVRLNVHAKITYEPNRDFSGYWYLFIDVRNSVGERVGTGWRSQTIAPWTKVDYADEQLTISCGRFNYSDVLTVNLLWSSSYDIPLVYTAFVRHLATRKVWIKVAEISPVPPDGNGRKVGIYQCPICGAMFLTQADLDAHIAEAHEFIPAPIYKCPYCGVIFPTQAALDAHIAAVHAGETTPTPTPTPTPPGEKTFWDKYGTWVIIGGVAILALTMMPREKRR